MNFDRDDEKVEVYLKQFRVRAPRPLPGKVKTVFFLRPAALMTAAAALILIAVSLLVMRQRPEQVRPKPAQTAQQAEPALQEISFVRLSRIAQHEPEKLDSHLDHLSTQLLPDVRTSHGVLKQLAHE